MAKRNRKPGPSVEAGRRGRETGGQIRDAAERRAEARIVALAEQLGRIAGTIQAKRAAFLDSAQVKEQLLRARDSAAELLDHLPTIPGLRRKGRKPRKRGAAPVRTAGESARAAAQVAAPGKKHRVAPPLAKAVKKSDETIAKQAQSRRARPARRG